MNSLESKSGPGAGPGSAGRVCRHAGWRIGDAKPIFVSDKVRAGLGAGGFPLLLAKPGGGIDLRR